jgi:RimJ/RimL family protein N-acetyltransferase
MFIRTERLFLRPAWPEDCQDLHAALAHESVVRNLSCVPWPYTLEDAQAFVVRPQDRRHPHFLITLPSARGSRIIGGIGLAQEEGGAHLGYWLTPEVWGRGYATEAARAVLRLARTLGHREISARHRLDNPASGRVLEKVGFRAAQQTMIPMSSGPVPALSYIVRFGTASDCDGDGGGGAPCGSDMRAA